MAPTACGCLHGNEMCPHCCHPCIPGRCRGAGRPGIAGIRVSLGLETGLDAVHRQACVGLRDTHLAARVLVSEHDDITAARIKRIAAAISDIGDLREVAARRRIRLRIARDNRLDPSDPLVNKIAEKWLYT